MDILYTIRYTHRKSISIRILPNKEVIVWAPYHTSKTIIDNFIQSKMIWINKHLQRLSEMPEPKIFKSTKEQKEKALIQILPRIEYYAGLMDLKNNYGTIKITSSKGKRWSCSSTWNLMFHRRLAELPLFVLDYVVVHELAHIIHFNHSKEFRAFVENYYPDYKKTKKWLKENGQHRSIS